MSKKRPGYEASKRLCDTIKFIDDDDDSSDNDSNDHSDASIVKLWTDIEAQLPEVLSSIPNLTTLTTSRQELMSKLSRAGNKDFGEDDDDDDDNYLSLSKNELMTVVQWKFAVGKTRNALLGHLRSNKETTVKASTRSALSVALNMVCVDEDGDEGDAQEEKAKNNVKTAITELTAPLAGVGPATASAILSMIRPDEFCYMYDEVIDCFSSKRSYSLKEYLLVNQECTKIAQSLNKMMKQKKDQSKKKKKKAKMEQEQPWTSFRVSQTLWIAARICKGGGDLGVDLTLSTTPRAKNKRKSSSSSATSSKRQRKKSGRTRT